MGVEHLQMPGKECRNPGLFPPFAAEQRQHGEDEPQILHPPEIEGNLNGQRTKENVEQRRSIHHPKVCPGNVRHTDTRSRLFLNLHEPSVI